MAMTKATPRGCYHERTECRGLSCGVGNQRVLLLHSGAADYSSRVETIRVNASSTHPFEHSVLSTQSSVLSLDLENNAYGFRTGWKSGTGHRWQPRDRPGNR